MTGFTSFVKCIEFSPEPKNNLKGKIDIRTQGDPIEMHTLSFKRRTTSNRRSRTNTWGHWQWLVRGKMSKGYQEKSLYPIRLGSADFVFHEHLFTIIFIYRKVMGWVRGEKKLRGEKNMKNECCCFCPVLLFLSFGWCLPNSKWRARVATEGM